MSPSGVVPPSSQDVMPPKNVSVLNVDSVGLAGVSGSQIPQLGITTPVHGRSDQLRDCGDIGLTQHVVSADVHGVPRSVSSFDPSSLLFPLSDSGFSSLSASAPPLSSFSASSSFSVSSTPSFTPPPTVPIFSLPSVVPSVLSAPTLPSSSSFPSGPPLVYSSSLPPFSLPSSVPSFPGPLPSSSSFPVAVSSSSWFPLPPSSSAAPASSSVLPPVSSSSAPSVDFAASQAGVLGLSDEYQALGRWYFVFFCGFDAFIYSSFYCSDLLSSFCCAFCSLRSGSPSSDVCAFLRSFSPFSSSVLPSSALPLSSAPFPSSAFPFSVRPGASVPASAPSAPLAPSLTLQGFHLRSLLLFLCGCMPLFLRVLRWGFRCLREWGLLRALQFLLRLQFLLLPFFILLPPIPLLRYLALPLLLLRWLLLLFLFLPRLCTLQLLLLLTLRCFG